MISALSRAEASVSALGNSMNSTAALTPAQRAWINALAPAVVLIVIALMGLLG
jgi:uncharacterized protein YecT (DUF1311 family)